MSYITRKPRPARADLEEEFDYWCDQPAAQTNITVFEPEEEAQPIGLLDAHGNEICRVRDRVAMGYRVK